MARPLRLTVENGVYHVTTRGNARREIFENDRDRRLFLRLLARTIGRFDWRCLSYCLMPNHFHLLVRTPQPNLPRGMQQLKSTYAQAFNRRHDRIGHLFAGRYGARLIQKDTHLLAVSRYIALNPVAAGLCDRPEDWLWSAHAALLGVREPPRFLAIDESLAWFETRARSGLETYREFVAGSGDLPEHESSAVLGDRVFLRQTLPERRPSSEIPVHAWGPGRPRLDELFEQADRDSAAARAYLDHGYRMSEIARHLGCHVSTVSRRVRAYERAVLDCKI